MTALGAIPRLEGCACRGRHHLFDLRDLDDRADQQHNWTMQGDPRGIYGESLAAPM